MVKSSRFDTMRRFQGFKLSSPKSIDACDINRKNLMLDFMSEMRSARRNANRVSSKNKLVDQNEEKSCIHFNTSLTRSISVFVWSSSRRRSHFVLSSTYCLLIHHSLLKHVHVGTWPEVALDPYNSIPTAHDEDEGRQITERDADPSANLISALLFAFISAGPQNAAERIAEMAHAFVCDMHV